MCGRGGRKEEATPGGRGGKNKGVETEVRMPAFTRIKNIATDVSPEFAALSCYCPLCFHSLLIHSPNTFWAPPLFQELQCVSGVGQ